MPTIAMQWPNDLLSWVFVFLASLAVVLLQLRQWSKLPLPLPPGPKPLPIIGNLMMMGQLTHRGLAALAERYGGLLHLRLGRRYAVRLRGVHGGVRARGAAGAGRRLREPAGHRRDRVPHLRPRRHGVRAVRALVAPGAQSLRHEALQPAPRPDVARRARRVRGARARPRAAQRRRRGGQPRRADPQPAEQERRLPRRVWHPRRMRGRRRPGRVRRRPQGVLSPHRRVQHRRLHPVARLDRPEPPQPRETRNGFDRLIDKIIDDHIRRGRSSTDAEADIVDEMLACIPGDDAVDDRHGSVSFTRGNVKAVILVRTVRVCISFSSKCSPVSTEMKPIYHRVCMDRLHAGFHVWWDGDGGVVHRVGDERAAAEPRRPTATAAGARRRGGRGPERVRVRHRQPPLPVVRRQGDAPRAPADPAAAPRDGQGLRRRRLLRAKGIPGDGPRLGHRPRPPDALYHNQSIASAKRSL